MELDHMLSFENGGAEGSFFIDVEKEWCDQVDKQLLNKMTGL